MLALTSLLLGAGLGFNPPEPEPNEPPEHALRLVASEPEPAPIEFAEPPPAEAAPPDAIAVTVEPPAPIVEPTPYLPPGPVMVDSKRPGPGTGRIALGSVSMAASSVLAITALAGPGWLDLDRREAIIAGGVAVPLALAGFGMIVSGSKSARRYEDWASRNQLSPPESGNGMLVVGALMTVGFAGTAAYGAQWALTNPNPQRGNWAPAVVSGSASAIGMVLLGAGMLKRSKYASWERSAYVLPGPMALERGAGVAISGRF
jgi:hypothetical protein